MAGKPTARLFLFFAVVVLASWPFLFLSNENSDPFVFPRIYFVLLNTLLFLYLFLVGLFLERDVKVSPIARQVPWKLPNVVEKVFQPIQ